MRGMMRWLALFILAGAVAVLVWVKTRPQPLEIIIQPVVRGKVEQTVANTRAGTVEACRRAKLSPSIGGQIGRLPIREGIMSRPAICCSRSGMRTSRPS